MEYKCSSKEKKLLFGKIKTIFAYKRLITEKDQKYLTYTFLGEEFISADIRKRNWVVLYINTQLKPGLVLTDEHGRFITKTFFVALSKKHFVDKKWYVNING